ncbi:MAG: hypothetical protein GY818_18350, partial [Planctomycetaceae bacterium]|nr:hypothetical protein [Planctomycetaceae bacterium]
MKTSLWQIIYESAQKRVHFRFAGEKTHSTIDLKNLNFKCDAKLLAMDLNGELTGEKRKFVSYNGKLNYSLLKSSLSKLKSDAFNEQVIQGLAAFPDATS